MIASSQIRNDRATLQPIQEMESLRDLNEMDEMDDLGDFKRAPPTRVSGKRLSREKSGRRRSKHLADEQPVINSFSSRNFSSPNKKKSKKSKLKVSPRDLKTARCDSRVESMRRRDLRDSSAIQIQSIVRGFLQRKRNPFEQPQVAAAVKLQTHLLSALELLKYRLQILRKRCSELVERQALDLELMKSQTQPAARKMRKFLKKQHQELVQVCDEYSQTYLDIAQRAETKVDFSLIYDVNRQLRRGLDGLLAENRELAKLISEYLELVRAYRDSFQEGKPECVVSARIVCMYEEIISQLNAALKGGRKDEKVAKGILKMTTET